MKLSLLLMVKNESEMLKKTLPNFIKAKIPVYVLDTGSTDDTIDYLHSQGATVFQYDDWDMNFAKARNALLDKVESDWVLFLDADEYMELEAIIALHNLVQETNCKAFALAIHQNRPGELNVSDLQNRRIKLFCLDAGFRYQRPVNETLQDKEGVNVLAQSTFVKDVCIYHWGNYYPEDKKFINKKEFYLKVFQNALKDKAYAKDYNLWYQLGTHYRGLKKYPETISCYLKSIRYCKNDQIKHFLYHDLLNMLLFLKRTRRIESYCDALEKRYATLNKELYCIRGRVYQLQNKIKEAKKYYLKSVAYHNPKDPFLFTLNYKYRGFFQYVALGYIEEKQGQFEQAKEYYLKASELGSADVLTKSLKRISSALEKGSDT
ncbi:MAG: glycosyltransferase [Candidatus Margulisbacteria bacterium]|nr:glycosyltransferase [Candidatus Margulisiibacteriota bacterium]